MASKPAIVRVCVLLAALVLSGGAAAQSLGHRIPGTLGLDAGKQNDPGLYLVDQAAWFGAMRATNRFGEPLAVSGLNVTALANAFGLGFTWQVGDAYLSAAAAVPLAYVHLNSDTPEVSLDKFGLADARLMPLKLGWRFSRADLVTSYALYVPTGRFEPGGTGGLSRGSLTHEFDLGGAVYFDAERRVSFSALASYELNLRKFGLALTRGDTLQLQGGLGVRFCEVLSAGVAGYALWQVRDDEGADLPAALRGARDRVFGLGPEVAGLIPALRTRIALRYEWDFAARTRPEGHIFTVTFTFNAWKPSGDGATRSRSD